MTSEYPFDRITIEAGMMEGRPCIRGMRITVRRLFDLLATYPDRAELFREFPALEEEDLRQAPAFASANLEDILSEERVA
jgi:uncharacterized protein (DUF433 family)